MKAFDYVFYEMYINSDSHTLVIGLGTCSCIDTFDASFLIFCLAGQLDHLVYKFTLDLLSPKFFFSPASAWDRCLTPVELGPD